MFWDNVNAKLILRHSDQPYYCRQDNMKRQHQYYYMKVRLIAIAIISFIMAYGCSDESSDTYTICTNGEIININDRMNNQTLEISDWPLDIRGHVTANFPGYYVESMSTYNLLAAKYFIVKMNNGGYILFDSNKVFSCADGTFIGGPRMDIGMLDTTMTGVDTTTVIDTTGVVMDTLITIVEEGLCDSDEISFERQILPLMASGCAYSGCHDTQSHEDGVILEDYDGVRKEVKANNVSGSEIIKTFRANVNSDKFMPPLPAISFTDEQIKLVEDWISQGATNTNCNIPCNSLETSWSKNIYPLMVNSCIGCHQTTNDLGGVNLETYEHTLFYVNSGALLGSIKHDSDYDPMPEVAFKLTECQIAMVENWITEGALKN